jgi:hypothetical protein
LRLAAAVAALVTLAGVGATMAAAAASGIVVSEFRTRGPDGGNDEFIELRNHSSAAVDISGWLLQGCASGSPGNASTRATVVADVVLGPGQSYLFANSTVPDYSGTVEPNQTYGTGITDFAASNFAGIRIVDTSGTVADGVGSPQSPCREGTGFVTPGTNGDNSFERIGGTADTDNNVADFTGPKTGDPQRWDRPADPAPTVASSTPGAGATGVATTSNVTLTFSEPVNVSGDWFTISCQTSGVHTASATGGPTTFTLDPTTDFAVEESCTVTVLAANVTDQDTNDPPDNMAANHVLTFHTVLVCGNPATRIHEIQGTGAAAALTGVRTILGVVVGDYQQTGGFNGYYLQEEVADQDTNPQSSEGIFVFAGASGLNVNAGDVVRVRGTAGEFSGLTQISSLTGAAVCASGASVPATPVSLPVMSVTDHERYEGMLVSYSQTLTASEVFNLGRFGEVLLSGIGRLPIPTAVASPGADAQAQANQNARSRIILDDGDNQQNIDPTVYPFGGLTALKTLRVGDTVVPGLTGVMDFRFSNYRIQPVGSVHFTASNPRPAAPDPVGGDLKIASFNVLNYFNGDGLGGGFPTARGAETPFEFGRQRTKIISALQTMNADIVGLMEIENDASPNSAIADLVAGLNAAMGAGTYAFIDTGVIGTDAIKVGLIYKPGAVQPDGDWEILTTADDPRFIDTRNRPALAQTFEQVGSGETVTVVVNHLKSKGSDCLPDDPDTGDGSGNCNGTRTLAAQALVDWIAGDPTGSGDDDVLVMGDLNSYTFETPIETFVDAGYVNLIREFHGLGAYSFVFMGESGYLDHALATPSLDAQATGVSDWHINADEPTVLDYNTNFKTANHVTTLFDPGPYRSADHDPVLVGLLLSVTHNELCDLTRLYSASTTVADSLCEKLAAAAAAAARDQAKTLKNYVNQVHAQTGKALTAAEAERLIRFAESL